MRGIADRVEQVLGQAVVATTPVAGGDICTATRVRLSDGGSALVKTRPGAADGFFETEARCLRWLAEPGAAHVAEVLAVEHDCLVLRWVEPARPNAESATTLGRELARLHASGADGFGAEQDGFIATLPLPNSGAPTWPEFYATKRVLPYLKLAADRDHIESADVETVEAVVRRLTELAGPEEPPARIHGDLWSGNIVWGHRARHPRRSRRARGSSRDRPGDARPLRRPPPPAAPRRLPGRDPARRRLGGASAPAPAVPPARARRPVRRSLRAQGERGGRARPAVSDSHVVSTSLDHLPGVISGIAQFVVAPLHS